MSLAKLREAIDFDAREPRTSYSAITLHRKCPQAWFYRYGLRIDREEGTPTPYLTVGSWWSALRAAESLERGRGAGTLRFVPETLEAEGTLFNPDQVTLEDVLAAARKRWSRGMTDDQREMFVEKLGEPLPDRLANMYAMWDRAHRNRFIDEQPLGVEVYWERELPKPSGDHLVDLDQMPTFKLVGYIDELYHDTRRGMTVIRDHKANSSVSQNNSALDSLMDSQLQVYAWGVGPKLKAEGLAAPRAIAFDRMRSTAPTMPAVTATGALSKSVTDYDAETYKRWAHEDGRPDEETIRAVEEEHGMIPGALVKMVGRMEPGPFWGKLGELYKTGAKKGLPKFGTYAYDPEVYAKLSTPAEQAKWTVQPVSPVNRNMVQAHLRAAVDTAVDIFQTQRRGRARGEAARNLTRMGCQMCDFAELCRAQMLGGPSGEYDLASLGLVQKPAKTN